MVGKVLITGASGLLGREILKVFQSSGFNVLGLCHSRTGPNLIPSDLTDCQATKELLSREAPDLIIHSAAQRFPDKVEHDFEAAKLLNVEATRNLALAGKSVGAKVFYISTNYVFDGKNPPFKTDDTPCPLNKYGETKLLGEGAVLDVDRSNAVLRVPVLYGDVEALNESAVTTLLDTVRSGKPAKISSYEVRCPAHCNDIARILADMAGRRDEMVGVYQWCGLEKMSKWDMVREIGEMTGSSLGHLEEVKGAGQGAARPRDVEMDRSRLTDLGINHHTVFKHGIKQVLEKWL